MRALTRILPRLGPLFALIVLAGLAYAFIPDFRKTENFFNIVNQNAYVGIVAVGMTYVMILGGIDLSVGAMVGLLAGLGVTVMNAAVASGASPAAAMAAGLVLMLVGGPLLGLVNGSIISVGRVAPFIATLGTMAIFRSAILAVAEGGEIRVGALPPIALEKLEPDALVAAQTAGRSLYDAFKVLGTGGFELPLHSSRGQPIKVVIPTLVLFGVVLLGELALRLTVPGRRVFAVGDNAVAARYSGVRLWRTTLFVYIVLGACCGLAAMLKASQLSSASSSQTGANFELDAIAAVVIGGTAMRGGAGSVVGTLIGVVILGMIGNILNMIDPTARWIGWMSNPHLQGAAKGCIIIAAVLLQRSRTPR